MRRPSAEAGARAAKRPEMRAGPNWGRGAARIRMLAWMLLRQARIIREAGARAEARRLARAARAIGRYGRTAAAGAT